jgi:hypothetical protein
MCDLERNYPVALIMLGMGGRLTRMLAKALFEEAAVRTPPCRALCNDTSRLRNASLYSLVVMLF